MPPLAQPRLGPAAGSRASNANWRIWSVGRHANISGFTQIPFCSTSSPLQSPHSTWLEETRERRRTQLPVCCLLPVGPSCVKGRGEGQGVLRLLLPWLGAGLPGPCHVQYIRGDQQASLKVRWHQAHAKHSLNPSSSFYPPPPPSSFTAISPHSYLQLPLTHSPPS